MLFIEELGLAFRSLARMKGLSLSIILTLALGIGVNVATFSLVRSVLLRRLVNRGEDRIVYLRQSAPGIEQGNATFSVPEIRDLRERVRTRLALTATAVSLAERRLEGGERKLELGVSSSFLCFRRLP
jgi:hypothetical protein